MPTPLSELKIAMLGVFHGDLEGFYSAYVARDTGKVYHGSEDMDDEIDEPLPADIDDIDKYIPFPSKAEFGLGKPLAIRFVTDKIPERLEQVQIIFSRRGAFHRFKNMLEQNAQLQNWYDYQAQYEKRVLLAWCEKNDIEVEMDR